jgi:hypothetical protein
VLKETIVTIIKVFASLPGAIVALAGLREVADKTGFEKSHPDSYKKLIILINDLLYVLLEHWIPYILLCVFLGTIWALLVVEPKVKSKTEFDKQRAGRLGE